MMKLTKAMKRIIASNPDANRLISKTNVSGPDKCWVWTGSKNSDGYGYMSFRGKTWKAHRVSFTVFCDEIPEGLLVCHHCDQPQCVNPNHLFLGTRKVNMKDMSRKGRGKGITSAQDHFSAGHPPRGEKASGAKLSDSQAEEIRELRASGVMTKQLASIYSVNRTTVQDIVSGKSFKSAGRTALRDRGET